MSFKYCIALFFAFMAVARAQPSPYFPDNGGRAVEQAIREIKNPNVYLIIAIAPGFENLASIANFRVGRGAEVAVAYVTNGEDIPSDFNGEMFYQLASRRKEEAYHALSDLGVRSYFLNIPINEFSAGAGCFDATPELGKMLNGRLDSLISQIRPDIIVLDGDPLSGSERSQRLAYLKNIVVKNISARKSPSLWKVKRLFIETNEKDKTSDIPVEQNDLVWSKTYSQMAHEAEEYYQSLRYQIPLWNKNKSHRYAQLYPRTTEPLLPLDKGLPEIGKELRALLPEVHSILSIEKVTNREEQLAALCTTIDKVDAFINHYEYSIDQDDLRILTTWKLALEKLRCVILGVGVRYSVSDTVVTPIQIFFLRFGKLDTAFSKGKTQVLFPGVIQKQWVVNEAQNNVYDWKDSTEFRVLSPRSIPLNSTETPQGFAAMQVRTPLIFIVRHEDPNQNHNFMYRQEIPLIIAPFRSAEVLTPLVVMFHDTDIYVRFKSNVRDKAGGVFYVNDGIVSSPQEKVELPGKNYVVTDTLPLLWKDTLLTVPHETKILAGQRISVGSFIVHSLDVKIDIKKKIGLCSVIPNSPMQIALHRLGVATIVLDTAGLSSKELPNYSAIIVDQFSFDKFLALSERLKSVRRWIIEGGRLIILPQYEADQTNLSVGKGVKFSRLSVVGCNNQVIIDSTEKVFNVPNKIDERNFTGGPFVISYGGLERESSDDSKILVRSGVCALLIEKRIGQGIVFYCGLNLYPRLLDIDKTSYDLLANLLSY
ncbi:MAG: PIG-L family deacetylase [Candidatus Kryptoniota bacterium]